MKTINCQQLQTILLDFIDKRLDSETTELATEHLNDCTECNTELEKTLVLLQDIQQLGEEEPPAALRTKFLNQLHEAKNELNASTTPDQKHAGRKVWLYNPFSQVAAGLALLISGVLLGFILNNKNTEDSDVSDLKVQVQDMKSMLFMAKLEQSSASQRIQAVNYTNEINAPDPDVIDALIRTMDTDENVNVRMASIHALHRFAEFENVREALVNSLITQEDALLQITLINILVDIQEKKAMEPMRNLLQQEETIEAVKQMAEKGLTTFI